MTHSFDGLIRLYTAVERISELKERYTGMNDPNWNTKKEMEPTRAVGDTRQLAGVTYGEERK